MVLWLPAGYRAETELEVRRSRFITTLARVDTEDAARALVAETRQRFPDARHHCSAFIVEVPDAQPVERSSDDGEPSGTAGMPMLDVLRGAGVAQAVAVVTRYFGGVLLGTGGLVRAYSDSVSRALDAAGRIRPVRWPAFAFEVRHDEAGRLGDALARAGAQVLGTEFGEAVTLRVAAADAEELAALLARTLRRPVALRPEGDVRWEEPAG